MAVAAVRGASLQPLLDVAVPVLLAVLTVVQLLTDPPRPNAALVTVCALAAVLPLAVRRKAPLPVTVVVSAGVVGQVAASEGVAGHLRLVRRGDDLRLHTAPPQWSARRSRPGSA